MIKLKLQSEIKLACCFDKLNKYKEAIGMLDQTIKLDPTYVQAYNFKGKYIFTKIQGSNLIIYKNLKKR